MRHHLTLRRSIASILASAAVVAALPAAQADAVTRRTVLHCVDVLVRSSPGGPPIAPPNQLQNIQTMDVHFTTGDYHYGFAYGNVNRWGYALATCFWNG